jgi:hypothetical protein
MPGHERHKTMGYKTRVLKFYPDAVLTKRLFNNTLAVYTVRNGADGERMVAGEGNQYGAAGAWRQANYWVHRQWKREAGAYAP